MADGFSHYEITRDSRWRGWLWMLALAVIAMAVWFAYDIGLKRAGFERDAEANRVAGMESRVAALSQENAALREKLGVVERSAAVDKEAYSRIEGSLKALQSENYALKQQLTVFQSIVAAESQADVVSVQQFKITTNTKNRPFRYRLSLTQTQKGARRVTGKVTFQVEGLRDGKEQAAPLSLLTQGKVADREFGFRQMQTLEGELVLPENFKPIRARVRVTLSGKPGAKPTHQPDKIFDWAEVTS